MRKGDWMQTYTGLKFYPLDPRPDEIDMLDIIHCLSRVCRYSGHTNGFYSVAEHSLLMARHFKEHAKIALLHDAAEAYFGDLPRPIKNSIPDFKKYEHNLLSIIFEKYGIGPLNDSILNLIETMDLEMLWQEKNHYNAMGNNNHFGWGIIPDHPPYTKIDIRCTIPELVEIKFRDEIEKNFNLFIRMS